MKFAESVAELRYCDIEVCLYRWADRLDWDAHLVVVCVSGKGERDSRHERAKVILRELMYMRTIGETRRTRQFLRSLLGYLGAVAWGLDKTLCHESLIK